MQHVLERNLSYMQSRSSSKVKFELFIDPPTMHMHINPQLFDWVVENLLKNALDATEGEGEITVEAGLTDNRIYIDVTDTGKGIPQGKFSRVFQPGYSTKKRGWGLGLSLSKRIIEDYHKGRIYVKSSTVGQGTTFRILLPAG